MAAGLAIALANGVVGKLGEIAAQQLVNETSLVLNFRQDFQWLQTKLNDICGYLQAAEDQTAQTASVKQWLSVVSDIALDAEDVIDECAVEPLYRKPNQSCVCNCGELVFRYKMGKRIKHLKDRMSSAFQRAQELNLVHQILHSSQPSTSTSERGAELKAGSRLETDSRVVAMEDRVREIVRLLEEHAVIAVVGMGGLGKTFLMQHVYERIKQRYDCSAWISVSNTCSPRTLLCDIARQINLQIEGGISDVLAAELIYGELEGKSCLIVLDDVWKSSVQGDLIRRLGLPRTGRNSQSKIVVTTRDKKVAANVRAQYIYEMPLLSEEHSWNLFCLFAFPSSEGNIKPPERLEMVARQIVEKCGRLPLAVKTVAASIAGSLGLEVWESKLKKLKDVAAGAEDSTMQILKLSYDSLPCHLKSCFAYFSFFPPDTHIYFSLAKDPKEIHQDYLIYLWIVEGLIPQERWHIGLNYLHQLVDLCLLEVNTVGSYYTVHDLLHDLVVNISREHKCKFHLPLEEASCRWLLLGKKGITNDAISAGPLQRHRFLRTLSLYQNPEITGIPEPLFDRLKVMRVLDLSSTAICTLPKCVGKLKLLKVLNLSQTNITEVPDCVRRLKSLQYLDVSECENMQSLPEWIGEVQSLSYLDVFGCSEEVHSHMPKEIAKLSNLRTLRSNPFPLSIEENEILDVKSVGRLTNLEEISFSFEDGGVLRNLEDGAFERLVKMKILVVRNDIPAMEDDTEERNLPAFPEKMNVMTDLQQLLLVRFSVPIWICDLVNLTELTLMECSSYPSLQKMHNLRSLTLCKDSRCRELPEKFGEGGGFPRLVRLYIGEFSLLEELPALEEGAMQCLEALGIINCPRLKKVPEGLERLRRLKRIGIDEQVMNLRRG